MGVWCTKITAFYYNYYFVFSTGDLGQTYDSNVTLTHYVSNKKAQTMLFVGDLSYADDHPLHDNVKWDTWGRFVEKSTAYQPWIWAAGNHEIDYAPEIVTPFLQFYIFHCTSYQTWLMILCSCYFRTNTLLLNHTCIDTMYLTEHHIAHLPFGILSSVHLLTLLSFLLTQHMVWK